MAETREIRIKGRAVSRGIGIGKAVCLFGDGRQLLRREIDPSEVEAEISRYLQAAAAAHRSILLDIERAHRHSGKSVSELLEAQLQILLDPELEKTIKETIKSDRVNSELAVRSSFDRFSDSLRRSNSEHIREKYLDLEDAAERLFSELSGQSILAGFEEGSIVAASELRASTLLHLREAAVAGIVTEHGGWTSHSSILAREFGIPFVTGLSHIFRHIRIGTIVAVDGYTGEVIFNPVDISSMQFRTSQGGHSAVLAKTGPPEDEQLRTLDGRRITIRTNTTSLETYEIAKAKGAKGIGLFRSEALIGHFGRIPTEEEQTDEYRRFAAATGTGGLRIRTFDIESELRQRNPALGLRAIRLGLRTPELLVPQIRAILRSSHEGDIKVVVPMINDMMEIAAVRQIIDEQSEELQKLNVAVGKPEVGAMIEVPSAALLADQVAASADFLCLGTNDLAQYILAADRDNETVSDWFRTLHPALLRIVKSVIDTCRALDKPFIVCGEMAGSPFYAPVLIGMGADDLSVGPPSVEPVRRVIAGIASDEAAELVREVLKFSNADDVERVVAETVKAKWLHLYPSGFLEQHAR